MYFARHSWQVLPDVLWSIACLGLDARSRPRTVVEMVNEGVRSSSGSAVRL